MANALNNQAVSSSTVNLFHSAGWKNASGDVGTDAEGVLGFAVMNTGASDALVRCDDMHGLSEWMRLPAGAGVTFRVHPGANQSNPQMSRVQAKRADSVDTTLSGGVVESR